ncbi:hypothetical protein NQ176_g4261 [Zarea fungicola]|uniref:Uncharacterized protein n=1 Tax=Zarea fungicola TaxID=93591 RepID=A0ACC1NE79_9HYPO|nr:hypothetical protein NQ176_g4261 [Lecanicillium fungicola]
MEPESAIPAHLRQERALQPKTPHNYSPPFPAYCARFAEKTKNLAMAVIGAQFKSVNAESRDSVDILNSFLSPSNCADSPPSFSEMSSFTDRTGFYNIAIIAYWSSSDSYQRWVDGSGFGSWWTLLNPEEQTHGWFLEVFLPPIERFETVFSSDTSPEGAAHMQESFSAPIREHGYWGSMRDRLPISQTHTLNGEQARLTCIQGGTPKVLNERIKVPGKENIAVIRSGQDWMSTTESERELYLTTMNPILVKGMNFLSDHGREVGCYNCRLMDIIDPATKKADKDRTFGLAYFDELASLERWSREHKTHLDIFGGFLKYTKTLDNVITLKLFHEVLVLEPEQQIFEYVCCHERTGMLDSWQGPATQ